MYLLIIHHPFTSSLFVPDDVNLDVPWLVRFVAGLLPRRPGFNSWLVRVGFVEHKVGLEQVFLQALFPQRMSLHHCVILFIHSFIIDAKATKQARHTIHS
jgi:hypothetical protein